MASPGIGALSADALLDVAIEEAKHAEFVAIDLEMTGVSGPSQPRMSLEAFLLDSMESAPKFLVVQMGFCVARRLSLNDPHMWTLSPYNFYVYPSKRTAFNSDSSSIKFLRKHGFDFNRWIAEGMDYERLSVIQFAKSSSVRNLINKDIEKAGLQRLIDALIEFQIPVVFHNGLFDILHVYDKFIGVIPSQGDPNTPDAGKPSIPKFCSDWLRLFSGGVYDTKHMACASQYTVLGIADGRATSLEALRHHLTRLRPRAQFELSSGLAGCGYQLQPDGDNAPSSSHEAGFDSMMTAQVFVMELEMLSAQRSSLDKKSKHADSAAANVSTEFFAIPLDWKTSPEFSKFRNIIAAPNVRPDRLCLEELSAEPYDETESSSLNVHEAPRDDTNCVPPQKAKKQKLGP